VPAPLSVPPPPVPPPPVPPPPAVPEPPVAPVDPPAAEFRVDTRRRPPRRSSADGSGLVVSLLLVAAAGTLAYVAWPKLASHLSPAAAGGKPARTPKTASPERSDEPPAAAAAPAREPRVTAAPRRALPAVEPAVEPAPPAPPPPRGPIAAVTPDRQEAPAPGPRGEPPAVERAVRAAAQALRQGDFATAGRQLAVAEAAASDDAESTARVARWQRLLLYAEGFGALRDQALAASVGKDYTVDGKTISIVEVNAEQFIYRRLGTNVRIARSEIPRAIVYEIVARWFRGADRPANQLFLGAYHVCREPPAVDRARMAWRLASRWGEADADVLLALLDDPALLAPAP